MKAMVKLRVIGNRLGLGPWSIPFVRSRVGILEEMRQSRGYSSVAVPLVKEADIETRTLPVLKSTTRTSKLIELARTIMRETEKLDWYIKENGLPEPSFDVDAPPNFPKVSNELKRSREGVMKAAKELGELVAGPTESIRWMAWDHNNSLSLHAIYHYKLAQLVPLDSPISFSTLASLTPLSELNVKRLLRHAMTNRIFCEPVPGFVAHTASSRVLATDRAMNDWVGFNLEDIWPAASRTIAALREHPSSSEPTQTGFCKANGTTGKEAMFETFGKDEKRAKRMGGAMTSLLGGEGYEPFHLVKGYDWASLDAKAGTVVDVGGSHGKICIALAQKYPNLRFIVQDMPKTIASAPLLPDAVRDRISFQAHDFFTPQPVKDADVYLLRWIFHNHSDKYASKILHALIPGLKNGARVVINDYCLPESGTEVGMGEERVLRSMDLVMLSLLNAQERSETDFKALFEGVDGRFRFLGGRRPEGCWMSILEAVWEGEDYGGEGEGRVEKTNAKL